MALALNVTVLAPCEWCEQYDLDEPLVSVEHGTLNLCLDCYYDEYCEPCRLCDTLMEPDEVNDRVVAVVEEMPGFPRPVQAGVYEVLKPSASSPLLVGQGWLWPYRLRLLAPLTPFDDDPPPCGYLCLRCRLDAQHGLTWRWQ